MTEVPPPSRFWRFLLWGVAVCALLAAALVGAGLWFVNKKASTVVERLLRERVFNDPARAGFERFQLDLLRGRMSVEGITYKAGESAALQISRVKAYAPPRDFFAGERTARLLEIEGPVLTLSLDAAAPAASPVPGALPAREVRVTDGVLILDNPRSGGRLRIDGVRATLQRGPPLRLEAEGRLDADPSGRISLRLDAPDPAAFADFEGEALLKDLSLPALAVLFPADPDVRLARGRLSVKTQFSCKDKWLTASHLVEVEDLKVEVARQRKKLFGMSVKSLADVLEVGRLSFVVPMNGSLTDPHVGVAASLEQILYKLLENRFPDKRDLEKWSRRGGGYLGGKIDRALREALERFRRPPP